MAGSDQLMAGSISAGPHLGALKKSKATFALVNAQLSDIQFDIDVRRTVTSFSHFSRGMSCHALNPLKTGLPNKQFLMAGIRKIFTETAGCEGSLLNQCRIQKTRSRVRRSSSSPGAGPPLIYIARGSEEVESPDTGARIPLSIQANYFEPLRRQPTHGGLPVCNLQLRAYSVRNLEIMADFALRAAYYAKLPASGPVPLPKKIERWTVPRGNFVHKKSQENYERVTYKRLIRIKDGHPETVELWLAFLRQHHYHGVGMKANVWGWGEIGISATAIWFCHRNDFNRGYRCWQEDGRQSGNRLHGTGDPQQP